jgi:ribosomal-protein-alanine N-acetyltransferase
VTARLRLSPAGVDDIDALHRFWIEPDVRRYLWDDVVISRERAADVVASSLESFRTRGFGVWVARARVDGRLVGFAGLRAVGEDVELLVGIAPPLWRRGFGIEAARAVLAFGFAQAGLARIVGHADLPNQASIRLMEALGMRATGRVVIDGLELVRYVIDAPATVV